MITNYCLTAYREESPHSPSCFFQISSAEASDIIKAWADIMAQDALRLEQVDLYNVFIHMDGYHIHSTVASAVETEKNNDALELEYQYKDELNQIILAASNDCDLLLKQIRDKEWRDERYDEPVPGAGRRG